MKTIQRFLVPLAGLLSLVLVGGMLAPVLDHPGGVLLAIGVAASTRPLATILKEMKEIQEQYRGKAMPEDVGQKFEELAQEAKALQDEADREAQIKKFEDFGRQVEDPVLPASESQKGDFAQRLGPDGSPIVGYLSVGDAYVNSEAYRATKAAGFPKHDSNPQMQVPGLFPGYVPITAKQMEEIRSKVEAKAITFTGTVVRADRIAEVIRRPERDRLRLRDVLRTGETDSNLVEFLMRTAFTNNAAPAAENSAKPESAITFEPATAPARTIAHWTAVTEQQLADVPQLRGLIDDDLLYGLGRVEETQILWGAGTGENLLGIFNVPGVTVGRTVAGDTLIDQIRRMITDVMVAGGEANAAVIHPYDWENIQLLKGTDNRYIWIIVTDPATGQSRLWGLNVVESVAAAEPGTFTTNERRVLVGDFQRGAALLDRQDAAVTVGWINDQFVRNQRTLRAEERVALPVFRPAFFRYRISQARVV